MISWGKFLMSKYKGIKHTVIYYISKSFRYFVIRFPLTFIFYSMNSVQDSVLKKWNGTKKQQRNLLKRCIPKSDRIGFSISTDWDFEVTLWFASLQRIECLWLDSWTVCNMTYQYGQGEDFFLFSDLICCKAKKKWKEATLKEQCNTGPQTHTNSQLPSYHDMHPEWNWAQRTEHTVMMANCQNSICNVDYIAICWL